MGRPPSEQRLAHIRSRARWAVSEVPAIAERGYASRGQFAYLKYLLERAYRLKIQGLPPRDEILARLATLEPRCTARWEKVKAERKQRRERRRHRRTKGANVDTVKDAEGRVPGYAAARQAEHDLAVTMVRDEIGLATYEAAKQQLTILEKAIREDYLPWVNRITRIAQDVGDFPGPIRQAVETIGKMCEAGPRQLRSGITMYEGLEFKRDLAWKDGRQVDINKRAWYIAETGRQLRSFDGLLSAMKSQRGQAETYIRQAEWPRRSGTGATAAGIIPEERPAGIQVDTGGAPRPPL